MDTDQLFEDIIEFPDPEAKERFERLVGLDEIKERLVKEARILLNPQLLEEWSKKHHRKVIPLVKVFQNRAPLFIFAGDIGTGKTSLAESFGDLVSREENIPITLYRLSLNTRGRGAVGEMTRLLSSAFKKVKEVATERTKQDKKSPSAVVFVVDEADALAQSRELDQMHHEDRAGVNALVRGIDSLTTTGLPILVVMCTNRLNALDPAVIRRSAAIFEFNRPSEEQRIEVLSAGLAESGVTEEEIKKIAEATGPTESRNYGYTYSDITQKILPSVLLHSYPDHPIKFETVVEVIKNMPPTAPFNEHKNKEKNE